ncbi:MAG: hypothetical protein QOD93_6967 [Acetobacteraceae bacterium]|jgi:hypothetical protein|nr:hypothetical protein [Acetobacteraceae bacterium]
MPGGVRGGRREASPYSIVGVTQKPQILNHARAGRHETDEGIEAIAAAS